MDNRAEQYTLGDYIIAKFHVGGGVIDAIVKILDMSGDGVGAVYSKDLVKQIYDAFGWDEFEPVPLVESDLERLGFVIDESIQDAKVYTAEWFPNNMRIYSYPEDNVFAVVSFSITNPDITQADLTNMVFVRYVHELRRILKVYGIEREIEIEPDDSRIGINNPNTKDDL